MLDGTRRVNDQSCRVQSARLTRWANCVVSKIGAGALRTIGGQCASSFGDRID